MDIFDKFVTDEKLETEGRWFDIGGGTRLLIARSGNPKFTALLRKELKARAIDPEDESEDANLLVLDVLKKVEARTILLGWEKLDYKGEPLVYSEASAVMLLGIPGFRRKVLELSGNMTSYLVSSQEKQGKD